MHTGRGRERQERGTGSFWHHDLVERKRAADHGLADDEHKLAAADVPRCRRACPDRAECAAPGPTRAGRARRREPRGRDRAQARKFRSAAPCRTRPKAHRPAGRRPRESRRRTEMRFSGLRPRAGARLRPALERRLAAIAPQLGQSEQAAFSRRPAHFASLCARDRRSLLPADPAANRPGLRQQVNGRASRPPPSC